MERIFVIAPYVKGEISYRDRVLEKYSITSEKLDELIETGDAVDCNGKQICFDIPIPEAYL